MRRLFGVRPAGALRLVVLCLLVGLFVQASRFDPADPQAGLLPTLATLARTAWSSALWMVTNSWQPLLAGAAVVLPIWVLWRLLSLPFRR